MELDPKGKCIVPADEIQRQIDAAMFTWNWRRPFPFENLENDELILELGNRKPRIEKEYIRRYNVDTTFNVMKAAIMRTERTKSKPQVLFRDLTLVLKMPVDIFLEIVEYLHPLDLYHLSKVCGAMDKFIKSHDALWVTVWRLHDVPPCAPGFSFPQWAEFLFGPAICDICQLYVALPDFVHLKRYCTSCMLFWCQWDELQDPVLRSVVPASTRQFGWVLPRPYAMVERWGREMQRIQAAMEQLERVRDVLDYDEDGAQDAFVNFITNAREEADAAIRHANDCQRWACDLYQELVEDINEKQLKALAKLKHRLLASSEGFQRSDLAGFQQELHNLWLNYSLRALNRRTFIRCIPHLITTARSRRATRLILEHEKLREYRRDTLESAYNNHLQTNVTPSLWRTYPPVEVLSFMDECKRLIYDKSHEEVTETQGRDVVSGMERAGVFKEWYDNMRKGIAGTVPDGQPDDEDGDNKKMNLATSVFSCASCLEHYGSYDFNQTGTVMFGWDDVQNHLHCVRIHAYLRPDETGTDQNPTSNLESSSPTSQLTKARIGFNQAVADIVKRLLRRLDLPEETTTVDDLDKLDKRLVVENTLDCVLPHAVGREALTWRESVGLSFVSSLFRSFVHHKPDIPIRSSRSFSSNKGTRMHLWT
ncbi:hypothetical protein BDN72DRAFT_125578 [Pluteus cervinus]|uniref:Uncharacterized protein n=1 Tax=Pluteus cervinus TaxID=181527 RepID=A0ACD3AMP5_9AGAR|nr:hypothetical protein BDN72DRAFT_125578 [Pluteus cervinus]